MTDTEKPHSPMMSQYLGLKGSPTQVDKIYPPPQREKAAMFSGSGAEGMARIMQIMKAEHFLED